MPCEHCPHCREERLRREELGRAKIPRRRLVDEATSGAAGRLSTVPRRATRAGASEDPLQVLWTDAQTKAWYEALPKGSDGLPRWPRSKRDILAEPCALRDKTAMYWCPLAGCTRSPPALFLTPNKTPYKYPLGVLQLLSQFPLALAHLSTSRRRG